MLVVCDFDGTVTVRDTNSHLAGRFAPEAQQALEGRLAAREMTVREVLAAQLGAMDQGADAIIGEAATLPVRDGFGELVASVRAQGGEMVLVSGGFRQVIEAQLAAHGIDGLVPLLASDIAFTADGGRVTWRDLPVCDVCGEECKRHDVVRLREGALHGRRFARVVFVGDGYSDRCGADIADEIFAVRDGALAADLDRQGIAWTPFETFHDVRRALAAPAT